MKNYRDVSNTQELTNMGIYTVHCQKTHIGEINVEASDEDEALEKIQSLLDNNPDDIDWVLDSNHAVWSERID